MDGGAASYGLRFPSRCVTSLVADNVRNRFLVGTQSLREDNEIHLVEYHEDGNDISCERVYAHEHEVWDLAAHPSNADIICSAFGTGREFKTAVWKMPDMDSAALSVSSVALERVSVLDSSQQRVRRVLWTPQQNAEHVLTLTSTHARYWDMNKGTEFGGPLGAAMVDESQECQDAAINVNDTNQIAIAAARDVRCFDLRSWKRGLSLTNAHDGMCRTVAFNPNLPSTIATGGDDRCVKFWDLRKPNAPIKTVSGHSHWVSHVAFNPFHDQLVLSASTDTNVCLWRASSVSSAPFGELERQEDGDSASEDYLVKTYDDHEDSVYSVAWSASDASFAFSFASLSYDGRLVITHVPKSEKYKIIL